MMMCEEEDEDEGEGHTSWSQSTICCSLSTSSFPVARKCAPSSAPDVLNDQHDPHEPYTPTPQIHQPIIIKQLQRFQIFNPSQINPMVWSDPNLVLDGADGAVLAPVEVVGEAVGGEDGGLVRLPADEALQGWAAEAEEAVAELARGEVAEPGDAVRRGGVQTLVPPRAAEVGGEHGHPVRARAGVPVRPPEPPREAREVRLRVQLRVLLLPAADHLLDERVLLPLRRRWRQRGGGGEEEEEERRGGGEAVAVARQGLVFDWLVFFFLGEISCVGLVPLNWAIIYSAYEIMRWDDWFGCFVIRLELLGGNGD